MSPQMITVLHKDGFTSFSVYSSFYAHFGPRRPSLSGMLWKWLKNGKTDSLTLDTLRQGSAKTGYEKKKQDIRRKKR